MKDISSSNKISFFHRYTFYKYYLNWSDLFSERIHFDEDDEFLKFETRPDIQPIEIASYVN